MAVKLGVIFLKERGLLEHLDRRRRRTLRQREVAARFNRLEDTQRGTRAQPLRWRLILFRRGHGEGAEETVPQRGGWMMQLPHRQVATQ